MSTPQPSVAQPSVSLSTLWDTVHLLLRGELETDEAARRLGVPADRLDVYPRFVKQHVRDAVEKNHAILASLLSLPVLGEPIWDELIDTYFGEHPPARYELNSAAAEFPAFIAERLAAGHPALTGFHRDLAALEWKEWEVFSSPVDVPTTAAETLSLNPTLTILTFEHPVGSYIASWRRARAAGAPRPVVPEPPTPVGETVFVFRHPTTHRVFTRPATHELLFAFKVAYDGITEAEAARVSGLHASEVVSILSEARRTGLII